MKRIYGLDVRTTLPEICTPAHMALLIYDMQVGIVSQVREAERVIAKVGEVLHAARQARMRVLFTRHMSLPVELMGAFQLRMAMKWQRLEEPDQVRPWFLRDSPGFPIVPQLRPLASEAVLDKITMSAFEGTPLNITLRDCGISAVAIAGIALEVGIEPTVRHAVDLGLIPVIISDACGSGDPKAAQRSLESLAFEGNAVVTDAATFIEVIGHVTDTDQH